MQYRRAKVDDLGGVFTIAQAVIRDIYPYFYPEGAVRWFAVQHDCEHILADISANRVRLLEHEGAPIGTVTIDGNRILRLFIAPEQQRKGYGTRLLRFAEEEIARNHDKVLLDSSLPSGRFFQNHGYRTRSHELYDLTDERGMLTAALAWEIMEKPLSEVKPEASTDSKAITTNSIEHTTAPNDVNASPEIATLQSDPATVLAAASTGTTDAEVEQTASTTQSEVDAAASPNDDAATSSNDGSATITISSDTASVMRQLPQMPF